MDCYQGSDQLVAASVTASQDLISLRLVNLQEPMLSGCMHIIPSDPAMLHCSGCAHSMVICNMYANAVLTAAITTYKCGKQVVINLVLLSLCLHFLKVMSGVLRYCCVQFPSAVQDIHQMAADTSNQGKTQTVCQSGPSTCVPPSPTAAGSISTAVRPFSHHFAIISASVLALPTTL